MEFILIWIAFTIFFEAFSRVKKRTEKKSDTITKNVQTKKKAKAGSKGRPLPDFYEDFSKDRAEAVLEKYMDKTPDPPEGVSVEGPDPYCEEKIPHGGLAPHPVRVKEEPVLEQEGILDSTDIRSAMAWSIVLGEPRARAPYFTHRG